MRTRAVIICGGRTDADFAAECIRQSLPCTLIAADSGLETFHIAKIMPDVIIGDFDSVEQSILNEYTNEERVKQIRLNQEKDETDTESAVELAISYGCEDIILLGATGTRIDHLLGNIHLLGIGLDRDVSLCMMDQNNRVRLINRPITLKRAEQYGTFVSLIPFHGDVTGVTLKGMKYPLYQAELNYYRSLGISNEIVEEEAEISFEHGTLLVIESKD
ncbi:MAG: thiamine diphosphokinase [Lachnospiraceae bacterium]